MKIHTDCQIEKVVSKDKTRLPLSKPYLRNGAIWASDGKAMVRLPVETEAGDVDGYLSPEALKAARKTKDGTIHANGSLALSNGQVFPRPQVDELGKFPDCEPIWNNGIAQPNTLSVAFDVGLLKNIADAFGTEAVRLELTDALTVIRVFPVANVGCTIPNEEARGLLMPIRTASKRKQK
jgi:hypothetical protein